MHTECSMLGWLVSHTLNVTEGLTARFSAKLAHIGQRVVWGAGEGARLDGSCQAAPVTVFHDNGDQRLARL